MSKTKNLQNIANILRRDVLKMTSFAGSGHPTSCMSCAEIVSALFFHQMKYDIKNAENLDNDEFILSKGHAAPILYAALHRAKAIHHHPFSLRKLKSPLEGHPVPSKHFPWAKVATGSLGQGLSAGLGFALSAKLQNRDFKTYVLLGDSEMAEGSIYEALQLASHYKLNNLIAIVDVNRLGQRGQTMLQHNLKDYQARFKSFGWNTITINGHKIRQVLKAIAKASNAKVPTVIIAKTIKGKGFPQIADKKGWHGKALSPELLEKALDYIPNPKIPRIKIKKPHKANVHETKSKRPKLTSYLRNEQVATRQAYGNALANLALSDPRILAVDAEVSNSTHSAEVKKHTPKQFIEAFIAEQNMMGLSLGLSKKGFKPFASSFAAFLSRAHDQIRMSALSKANLTICGSHAGVSIGEDGSSQMGLEDISLFRALPNSTVLYPSDSISTEKLTHQAAKLKNIVYIRTTRAKTPTIYKETEEFPIGDFKVVKQSRKDKVVLIGSGITLHESLEAYENLKLKKFPVAVIDLYCIKPLKVKKLLHFISKHANKAIITEDHHPEGGIGEAVLSAIKNTDIKVKHLAVRKLSHSGTKDQLLKLHKISSMYIEHAAKSL
jgi:transketolase